MQPGEQKIAFEQPAGNAFPQQQVGYQQPGVTIVTQDAPASPPNKFSPEALVKMKKCSYAHLEAGIHCMAFGIWLIYYKYSDGIIQTSVSGYGYGIWIGLAFVVLGGIGLGAVKHNNKDWITTVMIMNVISAIIFPITLLTFAAIGLSETLGRCSGICPGATYIYFLYLGADAIMVLTALTEFGVSCSSAYRCCEAVCNMSASSTAQPNAAVGTQPQQVVTYANAPGGPGVPGAPGVLGAPGGYGSYPAQQQFPVQGQYVPYPSGTVQVPQPVGYTNQLQPPPNYTTTDQLGVVNPGYTQPPPTENPAYPAPATE